MVAERALTTVGPQALAPAHETDWQDVRRIFRGMVSAKDNEIDAAIIVCQQLGFNPILNHIFLIKGQVYVAHKGLLNLAHRSGVFDGIEVLEQSETDTHYVAKVAVHRKDMSRPFIYTGRYSRQGTQKQYGPEMAITRAECMALRRAFDVSMPIYEEINWQEQPSQGATVSVREVPPAQIAPPAKPSAQQSESKFVATVRQMGEDGVTVKEIADFINSEWDNVTEAEQFASTEALDAIKATRRAARMAKLQQPAAPIEATVVATPTIEVTALGAGDQPATERQVKFIYAIGKEARLDQAAVDTLSRGLFGGAVNELNRRDATLLIEEVQRQRNEAYQRPQDEIDADNALEEVPF